jgi:hypothetical protein
METSNKSKKENNIQRDGVIPLTQSGEAEPQLKELILLVLSMDDSTNKYS